MSQVKIITSSKGGAGKTALACSLMLSALKNNKRVLMIDLNVNNLDLSRILCSSSFLLPPEGTFTITELDDDILLLSKRDDASLHLIFRKQPYRVIKTRNLWHFLEHVLTMLKQAKPSQWVKELEIIIDTSFNVTSLFPFSMTSQISDREAHQQSRNIILELQSDITETIKRMISVHDISLEIFIIVDSLRAKSFLLSEKQSNDDFIPLDEFNELRYYYRLEKKMVDELGQNIIYVFSPRPIIPEKGILTVVQETIRSFLGKKKEHVYYPLVNDEDLNAILQVHSFQTTRQTFFRVKNIEGFLASLDVDALIHEFIAKPRWEIFLEIEREIFQHLADTILHKDAKQFPQNVLIIPVFVHSMVNWSELISSHGKIIDEKDFEMTLGFFLELVKRWYDRRVVVAWNE